MLHGTTASCEWQVFYYYSIVRYGVEARSVMRCPSARFETCNGLIGLCMQLLVMDQLLHARKTAPTPRPGHYGAKEGREALEDTIDLLYACPDCVGRGHPASEALRYGRTPAQSHLAVTAPLSSTPCLSCDRLFRCLEQT